MKTLAFQGRGQTAASAIVRADAVTICGIDERIVEGDVPEVSWVRTFGHETDGTTVHALPTVRRSARRRLPDLVRGGVLNGNVGPTTLPSWPVRDLSDWCPS
ncbi:alcohol dehydrogenase catalytic domain-containing protein [Streptomyces nojiriensis]|uniref:alcohol dehydrogenase catalytic domain-containing protein n=1 Tax=Streptomyces nojiriensis TaxID=66374 RepID=UPI002E1741ED